MGEKILTPNRFKRSMCQIYDIFNILQMYIYNNNYWFVNCVILKKMYYEDLLRSLEIAFYFQIRRNFQRVIKMVIHKRLLGKKITLGYILIRLENC